MKVEARAAQSPGQHRHELRPVHPNDPEVDVPNDDGHVLDDGTLFRLSQTRFRLCCQERHLPWLLDSALGFDVLIEEETEAVAGLALQGPTAWSVLDAAGFAGSEKLKPFDIATFAHDSGEVTISRTGFTGDLGYELWIEPDRALVLWDALFAAGADYGIRPMGTNALEVSRIEAGFIQAGIDFLPADSAVRVDRTRRKNGLTCCLRVKSNKKSSTSSTANEPPPR
jgi:aminomethyltransferase